MKRGLHYHPASPRGRRRVLAFGMGMLAAMSLVWQQQATLASFVDAEHGKGTFSADTLSAITPTLTPSYGRIAASWSADAPTDPWATPQYTLDWSPNVGGLGSSQLYTGTGTSATLTTGTGSQTTTALLFTDVAAGGTHACGISQGGVYCWGTSTVGALGLGSGTTGTNIPLRVSGGTLGTKTVVQVTAGTNHTCVRTSDARAYCWGAGTSGQLGSGTTANQMLPVTVSTLTNLTDISAGTTHTCAVNSGAAYCWGLNGNGQLGDNSATTRTTPVPVYVAGIFGGRTVSAVSAGGTHSCAVADGRAFCWGYNNSGRLGNNSATQSTIPVAVYTGTLLAGRTVTEISAGYSHSCAVADGKAFCWGVNTNGRLGNNSATASSVPVAVTTTLMSGTVETISAGYAHTCAIAAGGAYCWGLGTSGQLGNAASASSTVPVKAAGTLSSRTVTTVSTGTNFSCATGITPAACWGLGTSRQMGDGASTTRNAPVDVLLNGSTCPDGSVRVASNCSLAEGTNYYFRLGYSIGSWTAPNSAWIRGTTQTRGSVDPSLDSRTATSITLQWDAAPEPEDSSTEYTVKRSTSASGSNPTTLAITPSLGVTDRGGLPTSRTYTKISVGTGHACGILGGDLYCWGLNTSGQLGLGDLVERNAPTRVPGLSGTVTGVSAGATHTCAVAGGVTYCWGLNTYGQLGDNSTATRTSPVVVANQTGYTVLQVSVGTSHSCAVTQGGQSWCWGRNNSGQLGNGGTTNSSVPVGPHAGAIPAGQVVQISAGGSHTCAVAASRAYCWGLGSSGQLGANSASSYTPIAVNTGYAMGTNAVTEVSAGNVHTCAIAASRAYCWGSDTKGQVGNGATVPAYAWATSAVTTTLMSGTVTAISSGTELTCATASSKNYCWGEGSSGQLGNTASADTTSPVAVSAQGALAGMTASDVATGTTHSCGLLDGRPYCWGAGTNGRLGNREASTFNYPQQTPPDALCAVGATPMGDGACSLAPSTTYYYRVSYTLDGGPARTGDWRGISTS